MGCVISPWCGSMSRPTADSTSTGSTWTRLGVCSPCVSRPVLVLGNFTPTLLRRTPPRSQRGGDSVGVGDEVRAPVD